MINCEECDVEIRAKTHKPPIWGVLTWRKGCESYHFCSREHGDKWVGKHNEYNLVERINA